ncbi:HAD family hydrolase [Chthonobacter rhizosphaerae]|uniref:HAD family hydrolase n=1 Tax=Chthonobacter rhizosphaerae TaxID=2735553 RepID=UPI0015EEBB21|nr:HAD family hydrolase [Chthonobacter rhizosphaerae]
MPPETHSGLARQAAPSHPPLLPSDWDGVRLVAFDVDGTLYRQRPLRLRMALDVLLHAARSRNGQVIATLRAYRRIRERLGEEEREDFDPVLIAETAAVAGLPADRVREIATEWMETRPLRHLAACRYPGLTELFEGLRRRGKTIGVLSDYPARDKLEVLGLFADHVFSAVDDGVRMLKPHPRGLEVLMKAAGATPDTTVLIGDRMERDGLMAARAGARALLRSDKPIPNWQTFRRYDDPIFHPVLKR